MSPPERNEPALTIEQAKLLPFYHDLRNEIVEPEKVVVTSQYFWTKWAPRLGPTLTALVVCLRRHCYYNRITQERRDWCFPEQATLAREIGVESTKTIRAALGEPLAAYFIRREARYVYDPKRGKKVRTSDMYYVAMDDPLTPEDEALLTVRAAERLLQEGRRAELALEAPPPTRSKGEKRPQIGRPSRASPGGEKRSQVGSPTGQLPPQDSAVKSTPEVVPEDVTNTTKYSMASEVASRIREAFAAANGTTPTPAQLARLAELARRFEPNARQTDPPSTGEAWILAAIAEAVDSGSQFVAPRRIARICERWAVEGFPRETAGIEQLHPSEEPDLTPSPPSLSGKGELRGPRRPVPPSLGGKGVRGLGPALPTEADFQGSSPEAPGDGRANAVSLVASALLQTEPADESPEATALSIAASAVSAPPSFVVFPDLGVLSRPLWQTVCEDARRRLASPGDRRLLAGSQLLDREGNVLVVGVAGQAASERANRRLPPLLAPVLRAVLGRSVELRFVEL
jgi:hypothetical protein